MSAPGATARRTPAFGRRVLVGVLFGAFVYVAIVLWRGVDDLLGALRGFDPWLVPLALLLSFGNYALRFVKWERYRRLLAIDVPVRTSWWIYLSGFAMGVTPGKMGEVLKSWLLRRVAGTPIHASAPIVVAERFTDLLGFLILVAVAGIASRPELQGIFWLLLGICVAALLLASSGRFAWFVGRAVARTPYFWRLTSKVDGSFRSMRVLLSPKEVVGPTLLSTVSWGLECVGFWLLADGVVRAGGVEAALDFGFAVFAYAFSAVAGAVLFVFPGGLGPTEGLLGKLMTDELRFAMGVAHETARDQAAAAVLLARLCTLWFGVLVGFVALSLFQRRFGRIEVAEAELDVADADEPERTP